MRILLHICCGVCASAVAERLICDGHEVTGYFYNPNIHPADEYERRRDAAKKAAEELNFEFLEGPYDRENWFLAVKGLENEPEGGKRCAICFKTRLAKTFAVMRQKNFDSFTTTLSISPQKDASLVNSIGREIGGNKFIEADFKKKGGFYRAAELSKEWGIYRQHYCGCIYSLEENARKSKSKVKSKNEGTNRSEFPKKS